MSEIVSLRPAGQPTVLLRFTLDELTEVLGFATGSLALHRAGLKLVGAVYRAPIEELLAIPGIGLRKLELLRTYFARQGLVYPVTRRSALLPGRRSAVLTLT